MSTVGQAVGGIVGGAVGFFVGGPTGALYGAQIGMMAGGYLDPPKGPVMKGPRLSDLTVQTSTYGAPLPRIYGQVATFGNIFWLENNKIKEVVRKTNQGGKGGGSTTTIKNYEYYATFAVGLADTTKTGPIAGIKRIWVSGRLLYNAGSDDPGTIAASNAASKFFRVYTGAEDQMPDPRMQADLGVTNCPAHRGVAYIVFYDLPLAEYGNSLLGAQVKVEVVDALEQELTQISVDVFHYGRSAVSGPDSSFAAVATPIPFTTNSRLSIVNKFNLAVQTFEFAGTALSIFFDKHRRMFYVPLSGSAKSRLYSSDTGAFIGTVPVADGSEVKVGNGMRIADESGIMSVWLYAADEVEHLYDFTMLDVNEGLPVNRTYPQTFYVGDRVAIRTFTRVILVGLAGAEVAFDYTGGAPGGTITGMVTDGESVFVSCQETGRNDFIARVVAGALIELFEIPDNTYLCDYDSDSHSLVTTHQVYTNDGVLRFTFFDPEGAGAPAIMANGFVWVPSPAVNPMTLISEYSISEAADLRSIIENECMQSNVLTMGDIDASQIDQPVKGYRVSDTGAIRAAIEPLQGAWPFDVVQRGYTIVFVPRGTSSIATIPAAMLDARKDSDTPGTQLSISNEMDTQLPRRVQVRYMDETREYDIAEQGQEKTATESISIRDIEVAIVLNADEAAGMAEVLLHMYWLERRDVTFRLPPEYRGLEAADVITITGEWGVYQLRLININLLSDGRLECSAKYNSAAIYAPTAKGEEGGAIPSPEVPLRGPSIYALLDIPLLADENNIPGWPGAMASYTSGWPGGLIYRSTDGGQTWADLQGFSSPVTMGFVRGALGDGRVDIFDTENRAFSDLLSGEISSISELAQLNGGNMLAYGAPGRWEICSPRNCELQPDGSYLMYDWLRGRFGTEWAMDTHQPGDAIILLTDPDVVFVSMPSASIGATYQYRGITAGASIDSDTSRSITYSAVNLKPLSPVYLNGDRVVSSLNWNISWIRRGRLSPEWRDFVDVPVGEASEAYEIDIMDGADVARTLTSSTPSVTYTAAQQIEDFGAEQETINVRVYQMSATVGRGYPLEGTLSSEISAVSFIEASTLVYAVSTSQTKTIPASADEGDLLIAVMMHRAAMTPPAGWSLVESQSCVNAGTTQYTSIYQKVADSDDAGSSTVWTQASSQRIAVQILAFRKEGGCSVVGANKFGQNDAVGISGIPYAEVTASQDGQIAICAGSYIITAGGSITASQGTQTSPVSVADNRMGVAYVPLSENDITDGEFSTGTGNNSTASVSVLIG